jgi:hypothetical protein
MVFPLSNLDCFEKLRAKTAQNCAFTFDFWRINSQIFRITDNFSPPLARNPPKKAEFCAKLPFPFLLISILYSLLPSPQE